MTLFEHWFLSEYISAVRALIALTNLLIVFSCFQMWRRGEGENPPDYRRMTLLFASGTLSNIAAAVTFSSPSVYAGLALAVAVSFVLLMVVIVAVKGFEREENPMSGRPDRGSIALDCYPEMDWKNERQGQGDP